jgi:hypothetical protein
MLFAAGWQNSRSNPANGSTIKKWSENNNDADEDSTRASELSELPVPEAQTAPVDPGWDDSAEEDLFPAF